MKKIIRYNLLAFILTCVISLSSCGTWNLSSKMKQLELGMTKQEVIHILGNNYSTIGAIATPDGNLETVFYTGDGVTSGDYTVRYLDGKLFEWFAGRPVTGPAPVFIGD